MDSKKCSSKSRNYCSVPNCRTYYAKSVVSMHRFPTDPALQNIWKITLKIAKPITKYMCVCSKHFKKEDYHTTYASVHMKKFLKNCAIPSLNLPVVFQKTVDQDGRSLHYSKSESFSSCASSNTVQSPAINCNVENSGSAFVTSTSTTCEKALQIKEADLNKLPPAFSDEQLENNEDIFRIANEHSG